MGQQVNISSKVKSPSESDYIVCNNIISPPNRNIQFRW